MSRDSLEKCELICGYFRSQSVDN